MTYRDYKRELHVLKFTSGISFRYHQEKECKLRRADRGVKILVLVLAVSGLVLSIPAGFSATFGFVVAVLSLLAAAVLNIVPVGDWEKEHGELKRLWNDLRADAVLLEQKVSGTVDDEKPTGNLLERLAELTGKAESLHGLEGAENKKLLNRCYGDEMESEWGPGIRTLDQAEMERKRRIEQLSA